MIREVCLYDKFSFCKNGVRCLKIHLKETCQNRECDYKKCNKRHPRPCRIFRMNGFCRFGTSCRYSHRLPKEVEDQNNKIESMEKVNAKLLKQVEDQNVEIKELKKKMLDIESKELKNLQNQINDLVKKNNEKEIAIKNLNVVSNNCGLDEQDDCDDIEEDVELEEKETNIEKEKEINHPEYVQNALECAKEAYNNIQKLGMDAKINVEILCFELTMSDVPFGQIISPVYMKAVYEIQKFLKSTEETKFAKENCILEIVRFEKELKTITL